MGKMETDMQKFLEASGLRQAQMSELLGISASGISKKTNGRIRLDLTDRLALAAIRAGLPPWTPDTDEEIAAFRQIVDSVLNQDRGITALARLKSRDHAAA